MLQCRAALLHFSCLQAMGTWQYRHTELRLGRNRQYVGSVGRGRHVGGIDTGKERKRETKGKRGRAREIEGAGEREGERERERERDRERQP